MLIGDGTADISVTIVVVLQSNAGCTETDVASTFLWSHLGN
jgi:hypothetical protein